MDRIILLYIDSMRKGGAQRVMSVIAEHMIYAGNKVILVNDFKSDDSFAEYVISNSITRYYLDDNNLTSKSKNHIRILKLRSILRKERPSVVLSFLGPPNLRMLIASIGCRTRKVVSVRNDPIKEYGTGIKKLIAYLLFQLADGCVFQTEEARKYFGKRVSKKSIVIFNPIDKSFYEQELYEERKEIIVVGRLQKQKNPGLVLQAFSMIADKYADYTLIYYGNGELKEELRASAKKYNVDDRVHFCGETSEVNSKLASAACYVLCSDYEGMPNALMEAMTVGVPCISTDCPCGGPRALIQKESQGILTKVGDPIALRDALDTVLGSKELRIQMRAEAKKRSEEFRVDRIMKKWDSYLFLE